MVNKNSHKRNFLTAASEGRIPFSHYFSIIIMLHDCFSGACLYASVCHTRYNHIKHVSHWHYTRHGNGPRSFIRQCAVTSAPRRRT